MRILIRGKTNSGKSTLAASICESEEYTPVYFVSNDKTVIQMARSPPFNLYTNTQHATNGEVQFFPIDGKNQPIMRFNVFFAGDPKYTGNVIHLTLAMKDTLNNLVKVNKKPATLVIDDWLHHLINCYQAARETIISENEKQIKFAVEDNDNSSTSTLVDSISNEVEKLFYTEVKVLSDILDNWNGDVILVADNMAVGHKTDDVLNKNIDATIRIKAIDKRNWKIETSGVKRPRWIRRLGIELSRIKNVK